MVKRQSSFGIPWVVRCLACLLGGLMWVTAVSASVGTCAGSIVSAHGAMVSCPHGGDGHDGCCAETCATVVLPTSRLPAIDSDDQLPDAGPAPADPVPWPQAAPALQPQVRAGAQPFTALPRFLVLHRLLR